MGCFFRLSLSLPVCWSPSPFCLFACLFHSTLKIRKYYLSCFHSALFLGDLQLSFSYVSERLILNPARHPGQGLMPSPHPKSGGCCSPMSSGTMDCGTLSSFSWLGYIFTCSLFNTWLLSVFHTPGTVSLNLTILLHCCPDSPVLFMAKAVLCSCLSPETLAEGSKCI